MTAVRSNAQVFMLSLLASATSGGASPLCPQNGNAEAFKPVMSVSGNGKRSP